MPIWAYLAGAGLALTSAFATGWTVREWKCEAAAASALRKAATDMDAAATRMRNASAEYQQGKSNETATAFNRQETIRNVYRDRVVAADCLPPSDARRVLDETVADINAIAAGGFSPTVLASPGPADSAP